MILNCSNSCKASKSSSSDTEQGSYLNRSVNGELLPSLLIILVSRNIRFDNDIPFTVP